MTAPRFDGLRGVLAADIAEVAAHLFVACFLDRDGTARYTVPTATKTLHDREAARALARLGGFEGDLSVLGRAAIDQQARVVVRECGLLWQFALMATARETDGGVTLLRRGLAVLASSDPVAAARVSLVAVRPPEPFRRLGEVVGEV